MYTIKRSREFAGYGVLHGIRIVYSKGYYSITVPKVVAVISLFGGLSEYLGKAERVGIPGYTR